VYATAYAAYASLPGTGSAFVLYTVTADNLAYVWSIPAGRYEARFPNLAALPGAGIAGVIYADDSAGQTYTYDRSGYAPTEGGNGTPGGRR
jgi:hypothetical protein